MRDVEMADVMMGVSYLRSRKLADIYYRIHLIEAYGTGVLSKSKRVTRVSVNSHYLSARPIHSRRCFIKLNAH